MTPWTVLLEALHSSVIDELTALHPNAKPELGMPVRADRFSVPHPSITTLLALEACFNGPDLGPVSQEGIVFLGMSPTLASALNRTAQVFLDSLLARAQVEFTRRGINPLFSAPKLYSEQDVSALPSRLRLPPRMIWIPFHLPEGVCCIGFGRQN